MNGISITIVGIKANQRAIIINGSELALARSCFDDIFPFIISIHICDSFRSLDF